MQFLIDLYLTLSTQINIKQYKFVDITNIATKHNLAIYLLVSLARTVNEIMLFAHNMTF